MYECNSDTNQTNSELQKWSTTVERINFNNPMKLIQVITQVKIEDASSSFAPFVYYIIIYQNNPTKYTDQYFIYYFLHYYI